MFENTSICLPALSVGCGCQLLHCRPGHGSRGARCSQSATRGLLLPDPLFQGLLWVSLARKRLSLDGPTHGLQFPPAAPGAPRSGRHGPLSAVVASTAHERRACSHGHDSRSPVCSRGPEARASHTFFTE